MIRVVMDGAGDMPLDWYAKYDIQVIPINIHFGERMYLQGEDLSDADFYRLADESGTIPKTSQPTPQQFVDFYKRISQPGDTIISVHVTSKLSGTYSSAQIAAQELKGEYEVYPFDSAAGSVAMGYMVKEARQMERSGASAQEILRRLDFIRKQTQLILTLNTLEYARMSGRVKTLQAALASILNVKPIIILQDGVLNMAEKVRTRQKAIDYVLSLVKERVGKKMVNVGVVHAADEEAGKALLEKVRSVFNLNELVMTDLSIGVAANLGPGTLGIMAYPVEED